MQILTAWKVEFKKHVFCSLMIPIGLRTTCFFPSRLLHLDPLCTSSRPEVVSNPFSIFEGMEMDGLGVMFGEGDMMLSVKSIVR